MIQIRLSKESLTISRTFSTSGAHRARAFTSSHSAYEEVN